MASDNYKIRVGSRKSELALIQTNYVIDCLKKQYPDLEFDVVTMTTMGDRILDVSLPKIGEKSLFTKDLEDALRAGSVDCVVHSLKDLPTALPEGLGIGAVFEREDPRDVVVLREDLKGASLGTLPQGSIIGTSSLRRRAQLGYKHPHVVVRDVRGNLNTRLRKLDEDAEPPYAALILAGAGLSRMHLDHRVSQVLPCSEMMYAVGQGALAVECRADDARLLSLLAPFNHPSTYLRVLAERTFLNTLGGGCSAPVGVSTKLKQDGGFHLGITGAVWSLDGDVKIEHSLKHRFDHIAPKHSKHNLSPDEKCTKKMKRDNETTEAENGSSGASVSDPAVTSQHGGYSKMAPQTDFAMFAGLIENVNIDRCVIEKCSDLGKDLAKDLISKGALDVMKISQDYIRSSIGEKS